MALVSSEICADCVVVAQRPEGLVHFKGRWLSENDKDRATSHCCLTQMLKDQDIAKMVLL